MLGSREGRRRPDRSVVHTPEAISRSRRACVFTTVMARGRGGGTSLAWTSIMRNREDAIDATPRSLDGWGRRKNAKDKGRTPYASAAAPPPPGPFYIEEENCISDQCRSSRHSVLNLHRLWVTRNAAASVTRCKPLKFKYSSRTAPPPQKHRSGQRRQKDTSSRSLDWAQVVASA